MLRSVFPFLSWFPYTRAALRGDLTAGITVALILVPQSMAYAQLAGLPVVYGLYASFVPVIVAALWGSCRQLHTGPVAMMSLLSAAAMAPLAAPGSHLYIELSIMLALMVGVLRLALGLARLGKLVNLVSSPVMVGFTNAAALIIGLSLLNQVLGVPMPRSDSYLADLWGVILQVPAVHLPTLGFAVGAWLLILLLRKAAPGLPGILIAVMVGTAVSAAIGFDRTMVVPLSAVADAEAKALIERFHAAQTQIGQLRAAAVEKSAERKRQLDEGDEGHEAAAARLEGEINSLTVQARLLKEENDRRRAQLHALKLHRSDGADGWVLSRTATAEVEKDAGWRFAGMQGEQAAFSSGGAVVGNIPSGLPAFAVPAFHWDVFLHLLPAAFVMALIGFMEATSISKAIAERKRARIDVNKELVGQGLANIAGSFFNAYTVSGSFSRSAVAERSGAETGVFAIVSALIVVTVLLFFTPLLYHLPQAVLAVIVMMAVFGLIRIAPLRHAWRIDRSSAVIGLVTFVATLAAAPSIANGILVGIVLTVADYLLRLMRPRAVILGRRQDGVLAGIDTPGVQPVSEHFVPIRFDDSLVFASVSYFEDIILEARVRFPEAKTILIVGSGINRLDASGEEKIREVARTLRETGVRLAFSSLKKQVREAFEAGGLIDLLGAENFYATKEQALAGLRMRPA